MTSPSLVDDMLTSLSHLQVPHQPSSTDANAPHSTSRQISDEHLPSKANNPLLNLPPSATQDAKSLFLTLHFLFPHELLPALDLLDRRLVTRLIPTSNTTEVPDNGMSLTTNSAETNVFYVQSASAAASTSEATLTSHTSGISTRGEASGRFRNALSGQGATQTFYEVRLDSWNCSCAAFAFSVFSTLLNEDEEAPQRHRVGGEGALGAGGDREGKDTREGDEVEREQYEGGARTYEKNSWRFGGTLTRDEMGVGVPVCKHILAAAMARAAPGLFKEGLHVNVRRNVGRDEMAGWGGGWGDSG